MGTRKKICVVTGSRAEYGLLYWVMREIMEDADLRLQIVATGTHLSPEFGLTYREIEADGFSIDWKVEMLLSSDTAAGTAKSIGVGIIGFTEAFQRLAPDIVVVLGDRFEILACAQTAAVLQIPVAHISGGEVTEGAADDWMRHSVTKMAQLHFVAADVYRHRVIQLGESPDRVFNVGDPGLDNVRRMQMPERSKFFVELGVPDNHPLLLVTYHPATLGLIPPAQAMQELLVALEEFPEATILMTHSNADAGGREMIRIAEDHAASRPKRFILRASLGRIRYLAAMKFCDAVVGNSSSGIVEAPAMRRPSVNIGPRQDGRLRSSSVIDCAETKDDIAAAVRRALSSEFAGMAAAAVSLYGDCDTAVQIKNHLKRWRAPKTLAKKFHDNPS